MYKPLVMFALLSAAWCQSTGGSSGDLDSIIQQIFGQNTSNEPATTTKIPQIVTQSPTIIPNQVSTIVPPAGNSDNANNVACITDNGEEAQCVRYYQCNDANNTVIGDGTGLIDIRAQGGACPSYMDTCCLVPRPADDPITPAPPLVEHKGCGWRNANGVGFRIKGDIDNEAKFGEFPWMVAILKVEPVNENEPDGQRLNVYVGGGSLIHPSIVLTAAHYVANYVNSPSQMRVRVGEWDTQTKSEIYGYQDRSVDDIIVHKDFNKGNLFYDVGLLFLSTPVDSAPHIGVACLPPAKERARAGVRCQASGWGKDNFGKEGRYQVILKRVEVPVVDHNTCQDKLRQTRLGRYFMLHSSFMCAGGEAGHDTCRGDGGSPLVCPVQDDEERYMQYGIVAWGIGCGENGTPGVYVDVANLRQWIDDKVIGKGYDTTSYTYV